MAYSDEELMAIANSSQINIPGDPANNISARQNNPGNIKARSGEPVGTRGFKIYGSPEEGFGDIMNLVERYKAGGNHTLTSFAERYAPRFENDTDNWIRVVGNMSGAGPNTPLNSIPTYDLARGIAYIESSTKVPPGPQLKQAQPDISDEELMAIAGKGPQPTSTPPVMPPGESLSAMPQEDMAMGQGGPMGLGAPQQAIPQQQPNTMMPGTSESLNMFSVSGSGEGLKEAGRIAAQPGGPAHLPTLGMIAGGALGGMGGGGFGAIPGAALGAGAGKAAQMFIQGQQGEQLPSIPSQALGVGKEMLTGATAEMGGQAFGKMMEPFANRVAQRMAENSAIKEAQALVEKGAPISPSEIAGTRTARSLEWLAEKIWPASSKMAKQRQSLQGFAEGLKDEFVQSRGIYDVSKKSVGEAWDNWVKIAGGPEATYPMPSSTQAVEEAMKKPFAQMGVFWKKHAATFSDAAKSGEVSVQAIRDIFNTLNPGAAKGAERTARMKIADAIMKDLEAVGGPEMAEALGIARDMAYMNRVAGPLRAIFNQSMVEPMKAGDTVAFNPSKFVNLWNQRKPSFLDNKNYSEVDIKAIDKFADQMRAMIPDLAKGQKFTAPTSLGGVTQFNLENPLAVGGSIFKQPLLALPVGADYWLAGSLMNPNGYMRKFLTTGLKPPTLPVKIGIMEGIKND